MLKRLLRRIRRWLCPNTATIRIPEELEPWFLELLDRLYAERTTEE